MHHWHRQRHRQRRRNRRHFGPWAWQGRFFQSGEIPLALLSLLEDGPKHGYELMKALESRSGGLYRASAGTVYPTLQQLQDEELVTSRSVEGGKRVYEITEAGRRELENEAEAVRDIWRRAEDDEWGGWSDALDPDAAEIMRPAFRLMRSAVRAAKRARTDEGIERVREILEDAQRELKALHRERRR